MHTYIDIKKPFDTISTDDVKLICGNGIEDPNKLLDKTKFVLELTSKINLFPEKISFTTVNFGGKAYSSLTITNNKPKPKKDTNTVKAVVIDFLLKTYPHTDDQSGHVENVSYGPHYITLTIDYIRFVHEDVFDNFPSKLKKINVRSFQDSIMFMKTEIDKKLLVDNI